MIGSSIIEALDAPDLLGGYFEGPSWSTWRAVLKGAYGLPMDAYELSLFRTVADRDPPPGPVSEVWAIAGRRAGKDSIASAVATTTAALNDYTPYLRPGERATVACIARDKDQARIVLNYIRGYFDDRPALRSMVIRQTMDGLELNNRSEIIVLAGDFRSLRGRAFAVVIFDEIAFFSSETSANPDHEVYAAVRPGMVTLPGSILIGISSPWKRSGLLYSKWRKSYGKDDPSVLVVKGASRIFNESLPQSIVDEAMETDPQVARAEWMAEWRDDLAGFINRELIEGSVEKGVIVREPQKRMRYVAFADLSGGQHDSSTAAIAHREDKVGVLDLIFEKKAPHSPEAAIAEMADLMKSYGIRRVVGDKYAAGFVVDAFARHGIAYEHATLNRSEIYLSVLPVITSGRARLIDNQRMVTQFAALERRTYSSGQDKVDHPRAGADDVSNAAAGALWQTMTANSALIITDEMLAASRRPGPHSSRSFGNHPRAFFDGR